MSRMLKPVLAGLAISSLCLALAADLRAQGGPKKKTPIKPVQAEEEESPAPQRTRPRVQPSVDEESVDAGEPALPEAGSKRQRPDVLPPVRIPKLSPELEKVLKDWEYQTSQFKTMSIEFARFKYDKTFEVEKRAEGKVIYSAPDRGNYEIIAIKIGKDDVSGKMNRNGDPYTLKSDEPERWVCTGKEIIRIDDKARTYEKVQIPPESQGQNIIDGPLPFLFGMKADRAKIRYKDFKLLKNNQTEIWLEVGAKEPQDARNWKTARIIIDAKKFTPKAVKLTDVTGAESVHVFKNVVVNAKQGMFDRDPFKPNLSRYKLVLNEKPPARAGEKPIPPATSKQSKAAPGNARSAAGDIPEFDLGRTPDSVADNPVRKKPNSANRK